MSQSFHFPEGGSGPQFPLGKGSMICAGLLLGTTLSCMLGVVGGGVANQVGIESGIGMICGTAVIPAIALLSIPINKMINKR